MMMIIIMLLIYFMAFLVGFTIAGIIMGRSVLLTNDIDERLRFILRVVYKMTAVVIAVYLLSPDSLLRDVFIYTMTAAFYVLYKLDVDELKAIDNRDLDA